MEIRFAIPIPSGTPRIQYITASVRHLVHQLVYNNTSFYYYDADLVFCSEKYRRIFCEYVQTARICCSIASDIYEDGILCWFNVSEVWVDSLHQLGELSLNCIIRTSTLIRAKECIDTSVNWQREGF